MGRSQVGAAPNTTTVYLQLHHLQGTYLSPNRFLFVSTKVLQGGGDSKNYKNSRAISHFLSNDMEIKMKQEENGTSVKGLGLLSTTNSVWQSSQ